MTIVFLQPDGVPITAQAERQGSAALYGGGSGSQLGGRSGFRVGTPADTLTATSTTWTLKPCAAQIDPGASTNQGMYGWASDANITGSVTASDATYARKDIVYIQVNDSTAGDGSGATTAPVLYLAGTPSVTPAAPALPARSFLVGTIDVPKTGAGSPTVTLNTARFVAAGAPLPVNLAERNALTLYDGLDVKRSDLPGRPLETYDGTEWSLIPTVQAAALVQVPDPGWVITGIVTKTRIGSMTQVQLTGRVTRAVAEEITDTINKTIVGIIPAGYRPTGTIDWFLHKMNSGGLVVMQLNAFVAPNGDLTIKHDSLAYKMTPGDYWGLQVSWWI